MTWHETLFFQQDVASPHYNRAVKDLLKNKMPDYWIGRGCPINCPASLAYARLSFFWVEYMKDKVYKFQASGLTQLKLKISSTI